MTEVYISVGIEADGPIPGPNSMLSIGAAAFLADRTMLGTFSMNLQVLDGAKPDPDTMNWWETQPEAWIACRKDAKDPMRVMVEFSIWVREMTVHAAPDAELLPQPVFVGYPAGFDFLFVYWYLIKFTGTSPFSFSALDIKSYAMAVLNMPYRSINKRALGRFMEPDLQHTHVAVDDAVEQGYLFLNLLKTRDEAP
jgi:hypothetical protein